MFNGVVFADSAPSGITGYLWIKETAGGQEWYELNKDTQHWDLVKTVPLPATNDHTHATLGDINFTGTIRVGGVDGLTGSRLIPGVGTLTFTKGILTGFAPV